MTWLLLVLLALVASALFAGSETGYYALNPLQLRLLASESRMAAILVRVVRPPSSFLTMLLVGNNLANNLAVSASIALLVDLQISRPELWAPLLLTPVVFLFGEVGPKQFVLGDPLRSLLRITPVLAIFRVLLLPVTLPVGLIGRLLSREDVQAVAGRRHLAALLTEGGRSDHGEAPVMVAALRALESQGKGLRPYMRADFPLLYARIPLGDARAILAQTPDTLALIERPGRQPALVLGTRLVHQPAAAATVDLALDLPLLSPDLDLADALDEMHRLGVPFALIGQGTTLEGVLDLEYTLSLLLHHESNVTHG
jgi:cyclin M-like protein